MDAHRGLPRKCPSDGRRGARPERGGLAAKAGREVGERVVADKKKRGKGGRGLNEGIRARNPGHRRRIQGIGGAGRDGREGWAARGNGA